MDPYPSQRAYWHQMQLITLGAMGLFENPTRRAEAGRNLLSKMSLASSLYNNTTIPETDPEKRFIYDVQGARAARMHDGQAFAYPLKCSLTWVISAGQHKIGIRGLGIPAVHYGQVSETKVDPDDFPTSYNVSTLAENVTANMFQSFLVQYKLLLTLETGASSRNELGNLDMTYTSAWADMTTHGHRYYHLNNDYVMGQIPDGNPYRYWTPSNLQHTYRSRGAVLPHFVTYRDLCFSMTIPSGIGIPIGPGVSSVLLVSKKTDAEKRNDMRLHLMLSEAY
jgi:hypothetical protein